MVSVGNNPGLEVFGDCHIFLCVRKYIENFEAATNST